MFPGKSYKAGSSTSVSHETFATESNTHSESPLRDITHVNLPTITDEEDSFLDEENTEDNINSDDEPRIAAHTNQMFPEMPGGVMQDTFELFSRYMTSILRQIPVAKSFSLQQQFINMAIDARMDYEKQRPSKSPPRDCFSSLPVAPVYPVDITEIKDKQPAKRARKRKRRNNTESDSSSPTKIQHIPESDLKEEVTEDTEPSETNQGLETTVEAFLESCQSEIDIEESQEFKPDVQAPTETAPSDPLEMGDSTSETQKRPGHRISSKGTALILFRDIKKLDKLPHMRKQSTKARARVCVVCSERGKARTGKPERRETTWWCPDCEISLCVPGCFKLYHTKSDYLE